MVYRYSLENNSIMKYAGIIIATVALVAIGVFAFAMPSKNPDTPDNPKPSKKEMVSLVPKLARASRKKRQEP